MKKKYKNLFHWFLISCLLITIEEGLKAQSNKQFKDEGVCGLPVDTNLLKKYATSNKRTTAVGYTKTDILTKYESKPGADYVCLLDFFPTGSKRGPYNFNPAWTRVDENYLKEALEIVVRDFQMFDINITTNIDVHQAADKKKRVKMVVADFIQSKGWAGETPPQAFFSYGGDTICVIDVYAEYIGMQLPPTLCGNAISHELGHVFGLEHDGLNNGTAYYHGVAGWGPIMGNPNFYATWDKGDYSGANNFEDDIAKIGAVCGFSKNDFTNKKLIINPASDSLHKTLNNGLILNRNDVDTFIVNLTSQGSFNVFCKPMNTVYFNNPVDDPNLDVELVLYDASYNQLAQSNLSKDRGANILYNNATAGTYYLIVKSGSEVGMFPNYGSWGLYNFTGYISGSEKSVNDNLILNSISGVDKRVCSSVGLKPLIEVENYGANTVNTLNVSLYLNNVLINTHVLSVNITSGAKQTITLPVINTPGTANLKVVVTGNGNELNLTDNEKTVSLSIDNGSDVKVISDIPNFNGVSPISWNIVNNATTIQLDSKNYGVSSMSTTQYVQNFCLPNDCYTMTLNGSFNICSQSYKAYSSGSTYNGGDKVYLNGVVYQAKWWTQSTPSASASDWSQISTCYAGPTYSLSLQDGSGAKLLNSDFSSTGFTSPASKTFCANITSIDDNSSDLKNYSIYPNPTSGFLYFNNLQSVEKVVVMSKDGKILISQKDNFQNINLVHLPIGIYIVAIYSVNSVEYQKVVKE